MPDQPVITRFAPSPTGHLHIGGARTALFCWAYARRTGGRFIIRVEDTDQARSSEASARGILQDLAWLGILWDEGPTLQHAGRVVGGDPRNVGPFFQSQRLATYNGVVDDMLERGLAYADFSPPEHLAAMRKAAEAAKQTFRYHPPASEIPPLAEQRRRIADGAPHVIRFRAADEPVRVADHVLGEVAFGPGEVDDFVLRKADGFPTYHFGVVVDDEKMGVTHVLRGQEHLMNTPRHVALQKALGYRTPVYGHMPLIFNDKGAKMSKRERDQSARDFVAARKLSSPPTSEIPAEVFSGWLADKKRQLGTGQLEALASALSLQLPEVSVDDFRRAGYLPEVICNFIALLGWNPGGDVEKFDMPFLAQRFDFDRIGKTNARFDRKKLLAFNGDAIASMPDADFARRWREWCAEHEPGFAAGCDDARWLLLARAVRPRAKTFRDAIRAGAFAAVPDDAVVFDPAAANKHLLAENAGGLAALARLRGALAASADWTPEALNGLVESVATSMGIGIGQVAQPLRVALTGAAVSPPLGETLAIVGRAGALARIDRCAAVFAGA
ncbi:MAG: glutamate--tRNA ligase [Phycisphaerales bacterium]|nr:glutamate--tRNA ligase [Phycisphaerales bacterium]